jgi:hypothetical protein
MLFGVPHAGSSVSEKLRVKMYENLAKLSMKKVPEKLKESSERDSDELVELSRRFENISLFNEGRMKTYSYYEMRTTGFVGEEVSRYLHEVQDNSQKLEKICSLSSHRSFRHPRPTSTVERIQEMASHLIMKVWSSSEAKMTLITGR